MKKQYAITIVTMTCIAVACNKVTDPVCGLTPQRFSEDVNPIIQNSCATGSNCHGSGSSAGPGPLLTYDQVKNVAWQIKKAVEDRTMPRGSTLSKEQINIISCWVENGALNN
jgi:hypothetical protein